MKKVVVGIGLVVVLAIAFFVVKPRIAASKFEQAEELYKQKKYSEAARYLDTHVFNASGMMFKKPSNE